MVSAIITAAGKNSRMLKSQKDRNLKLQNKLTLPFKDTTVIETTIENVLSLDIDECIVVLGHYSDEIKKCILNISDDRLKIIENSPVDVGLATSLSNGLKETNSKFVLCATADQPTVTINTFNKLIKCAINSENPLKTIAILRRKDYGLLKTAEGLGMPFVANRQNLIENLKDFDDNLNPMLRTIFDKGYDFYGIKEENKLELININTYEDYEYVLDNY
ncbi:NTP transferase domain-containing protein [Methanobrevibacter sp. OttesenSCG-928-I08]|nr:NTP transferase domain-containing protein [Methanobrevibacter sp. OttesenSCG-928-I08]